MRLARELFCGSEESSTATEQERETDRLEEEMDEWGREKYVCHRRKDQCMVWTVNSVAEVMIKHPFQT